ncbi:MAG: hypothetical protein E6K78_00725 [Candidatus Eisenbacteria bacterium]|uniref:beta-N-acetylhexosaminidase n=1 Tax=Eiseniibacteriota bacterium TaxID=2212470 RepID=A0A538TXX2_UNCEI|nr:MAG: hypothetical protein E6K78_00725 [Candidatus Eisenbacteria bacterium]
MLESPLPRSTHGQRGMPRRMLKPSIACSVALLVAHGAFAELRLVPEPRQVTSGTGHFALRGAIPIIVPSGDAEDLFAAGLLAEEIRTRTGAEPRIASQGSGPIVLSREALPEVGDQGYRIDAAPNGIRVRARTATGLFYGVQTLRQMIDSDGVPAATIVDWPALAWRGFHDDLSRGPVPTLASLERQVRTAAEYKMNLYALYMEHSFAYRSEPLIAPPGGALTATELKELDAYAKLHHVSLLLEQQTLSHLEGMLTWEKYRGLAEQPGSDMLTPASPLTYALIDSLLAEIAPLSSAPFLHIGADEASDLGQGQSRPLVEARGLAAAYVQHVRRVHDLLAHHGKRTIFWGDFVMKHPERLGDLPTDCIVASWSFEPLDSYADYLEPFRTAKLDVLVCPGVCNWSRVFPNLGAAIPNIRRFTLEGQRRGAIGQLDCSWDDGGEALAALLWYPALYGAAAAWQAGDCDPERFRKAFDWAFFRNPGTEMAEAIACLDSAHTIVSSVRPTDMTIELSWLNPVRPGTRPGADRENAHPRGAQPRPVGCLPGRRAQDAHRRAARAHRSANSRAVPTGARDPDRGQERRALFFARDARPARAGSRARRRAARPLRASMAHGEPSLLARQSARPVRRRHRHLAAPLRGAARPHGADAERRAASFLGADRARPLAGLRLPPLVGRRPVDRGQRHVDQSQVDAQLSAMVNQVIDGLANHRDARQGEEHAIAGLERPGDHEVLVPGGQCAARFLHVPVEFGEQCLGLFVAVALGAAEIERGLAHLVRDPAGHARHELGEVSQREGFLVWLPGSLLARNPLQQPARDHHLLVEFGNEGFGNAHAYLPGGLERAEMVPRPSPATPSNWSALTSPGPLD